MDNVHDDAEVSHCPGSGSAGIKHRNEGEQGMVFYYYECPTCGLLLPNSPLKSHHPIGSDPSGNR